MWRFLFSPYGRISRKMFWLNWALPYLALSFACIIGDFILFPIDPRTQQPPPVLQTITALFFLWPSIAVTTKRLHDRGMTGWWNALPVPLAFAIGIAAYYYYTAKMNGTAPPFDMNDPSVATTAVVAGMIVIGVLLYPLINILFLGGQSGANRYGDDPLAPGQAEVFS